MPSKKKKYNARFPPARIKKIMQTDEEVGKVAAAVPVIISRSLEMFIESLIEKTAVITKAKNAKTLSASHIKQTIHSEKTFDFLHDLVANIPDHVVEDEGDGIVATATVATGATAETKPRKIYRARKPREDGKRGPGRPRKVDMVKESNSASGTASENDEESDGADEDTTLTTDPLRDSAQGRPDPQQWSVASVQPAGQAESQPRVPAELHPSSYAVPVPSQPVPTSPSPDIPNGPPPFTRHPAWSPASDPPVPGPGPKMAASPTTSGLVTNPPTATQFSPHTTTNIQFPPHVPMNKQFSPQTTNTDVISPPVMSTVTTRPQQAPQFFPHMLSSMVYPPTHSPMGGPPPLFVPPAGLPMSPGLRPAMFTSPPLPYGTGPRVPSASYGNNEDCQPLDMSLSGAARSQKLCRQDASEDVKIAGGVSSSKPSIFHRPFLNDHPIANNIHNVPQSKLTAVEEHGLSQRGRQDHSVGTLDPPSKGADPGVPRMNSATSSGGVPALAYAGLASLMTQAAHIPVSNDSDDYDI